MDEETVEEMKINRKNVNVELVNMLTQDVICDMAFQNERTLCSCDIEQLNDGGSSRVSITGVLRGDAMISTEMGQHLYRAISPTYTWISRPHEIPMNLNIHFLFRCVREYTDDEAHQDWVINGFTFTLDVPDLFIAYIL
ncbi:uncharacterized protein LOC110441580 isoform X2 [Mizuhopecten yessoensis]|nr:uncharacterized protein LOC110441580 isoform X2 [Mizuhopecten yessoensis]